VAEEGGCAVGTGPDRWRWAVPLSVFCTLALAGARRRRRTQP
jgi:hypothetical protein